MNDFRSHRLIQYVQSDITKGNELTQKCLLKERNLIKLDELDQPYDCIHRQTAGLNKFPTSLQGSSYLAKDLNLSYVPPASVLSQLGQRPSQKSYEEFALSQKHRQQSKSAVPISQATSFHAKNNNTLHPILNSKNLTSVDAIKLQPGAHTFSSGNESN